MSDGTEQSDRENAQDAALAQAGEPHGTSEARAESRSEEEVPTSEDLDAREARVSRPRKAMGPGHEVSETVPEEP